MDFIVKGEDTTGETLYLAKYQSGVDFTMDYKEAILIPSLEVANIAINYVRKHVRKSDYTFSVEPYRS